MSRIAARACLHMLLIGPALLAASPAAAQSPASWTGAAGTPVYSSTNNWFGGTLGGLSVGNVNFMQTGGWFPIVGSSSLTFTTLNFANADYFITSQQIALTSTGSITVATPHKATMLGQFVFGSGSPVAINVAAGGQLIMTGTQNSSGAIGGNYTKTGAGTLVYSSPGSSAHPLILNQGTVAVVIGNELLNTSLTGAAGTTFDTSRAYSASVFNLATTGNVQIGSSALTVTSGFISGDITGGGSLIKGSGSTVTLGGTNQLRNITLFGGILDLQNVEAAGGAGGRIFLGGSRVNLVGGTYENAFQDGGTIANDADVVLAGAVSGVAGNNITKTGVGALTIDDASHFNGGLIVNGGTVKLGAADALRNTNLQLFVNDGLNFNGFSTARLTTISGTGNLELGSSTLALVTRTSSSSGYTGVLSSTTGGGLSVQRVAQTLQGANTYDGATTILSGGFVTLSGTNGALVNSTAIELRGGTLSLANNATLTNGNRLNDAAVVTLKSGTLAFQGAIGATAENYGGLVLGAGGSRVIVTTTTGAAAQLIAPSIVRQARGTVRFESSGTLGAAPGTGNANIKFTSTAPTLTGGGGAANSATISIIPYAVAGVNSGTYGLATYDATNGVRQLSTATEYAATITDGAANFNNIRLTSSVAVASAATEVNALVTATGGDVTGAGTVLLRSGTLLMGGGNLNVANLDFGAGEGNIFVTSNGTINSIIQGTGGINFNGTATVTLGAANSYSGGTYITGAAVSAVNENRFGSGDITLDGGVILSGATQTFTRNLVLADGGGTLTGSAITYDGQITGTGRLTVSTTVALTNSSNSFSGDLQINFGAVNFADDAALGAASNRIFVLNPGILRPTADWTSGREVTGAIDTNGVSVTLTGASGAISKTGATGLLSITGSVDGLTINQGTVELTGINRGGLTIASGATLRMAGADLADRYQTLNINGANLQAVGDTIIDQNLNVTSLTIDSGVHTVTHRGANFSGTIFLTKNGSGTLAWTTAAANVNLNAGTLVLSNTTQNVSLLSMSTGATLAITHAGVLPFGNISVTGTLRTDADMHLSSNVTLLGGINTNGNDVIMSGALTGSWNLNKSGTGRLAITGTRLWTGNTNVTAGELQFTGGTLDLGSRQITAASGATVEYRGIDVSGGFLRGAGVHRLGTNAELIGSTILAGTVIDQQGAVTLANITSGGTIQNGAALFWDGGFNTAAGRLNVNTTVTTQFFENNGLITVNNGGTLSNQATDLVSGGGSRITVNSGGTMNLLAGTTLELQGALLVNNGDVNGTVNVQFGSLAKGSGTFDTVNIFDGGSFSPGNSPGTQNVTNETWGPGGNYVWEINDVDAGIGVDPGWDWINISNQLNITSTSGNKFNIVVTSLTLANSSGPVHDFNPFSNYSWTIATAGGGVNGFDTSVLNINTSGFQNSFSGTFNLAMVGNDLNLTYTAVPEPSSLLLAAGAAAAWWRRRSKRRKAVAPLEGTPSEATAVAALPLPGA
jgi:fibronectin-binding autotransporter adhesin